MDEFFDPRTKEYTPGGGWIRIIAGGMWCVIGLAALVGGCAISWYLFTLTAGNGIECVVTKGR